VVQKCNGLPFMLSHFLHSFPTLHCHLLCHGSLTHSLLMYVRTYTACVPTLLYLIEWVTLWLTVSLKLHRSLSDSQVADYLPHPHTYCLGQGSASAINTWPPALSRQADKQEDREHHIATLAIYTVYTCFFYTGSQAEPPQSLYLDSRSLDKSERVLHASGHSGVQGEGLLRQIITRSHDFWCGFCRADDDVMV